MLKYLLNRPDAEVESSLPQESPAASDYIKGSGKDIPFPHGNEEISTGVTPLINGLNEEGCADECKGKGSPRSPQDSNSQTCSSTVGVSFSSTSSCSGAHCTEVYSKLLYIFMSWVCNGLLIEVLVDSGWKYRLYSL